MKNNFQRPKVCFRVFPFLSTWKTNPESDLQLRACSSHIWVADGCAPYCCIGTGGWNGTQAHAIAPFDGCWHWISAYFFSPLFCHPSHRCPCSTSRNHSHTRVINVDTLSSLDSGFGWNHDWDAVGEDDRGCGGVYAETRREHRRQLGRGSRPNREEVETIASGTQTRRLGGSLTYLHTILCYWMYFTFDAMTHTQTPAFCCVVQTQTSWNCASRWNDQTCVNWHDCKFVCPILGASRFSFTYNHTFMFICLPYFWKHVCTRFRVFIYWTI